MKGLRHLHSWHLDDIETHLYQDLTKYLDLAYHVLCFNEEKLNMYICALNMS